MSKTIEITDETAALAARLSADTGRSEADLIADLLRRESERQTKIAQMQRLVTEGLESGRSPLSMQERRAIARNRAGVRSLS